MRVVAQADWVIDMGPGAGERGGKIVAEGFPKSVLWVRGSRTASYLEGVLR
jgi:excinuclease ABC subunit A